MKRRRTAIIAFLLAAVLCLGVGYAALTDTLEVGGSIGIAADTSGGAAEEFKSDIYFSNVDSVTKSNPNAKGTATANIVVASNGDANDKLLIEISNECLLTKGDTVTIVATLHNSSPDLNAKITLNQPTITGEAAEYFSATASWSAASADGDTLLAGASRAIKIIITMEKTYTEATGITANIAATFNAESIEN